jgi:hypothetical protein
MILAGNAVCAEESSTPAEVIAKVRDAAEFLSKNGESGLAEFNDPRGRWAWKDTYVFVLDCGKEEMVAHVNSKLIRVKLVNFIDKNGRYLGYDLCAEALNPKGGWTEYWWPKAGTTSPERKISYVLKVPGQPYEVSAGIYNPTMTLKQLNDMLK